jgi:tetratricopeptide (TPR) repeat protein
VPERRSPVILIAILLVAGTALLYSPTLRNDFVNYDDPAYVTSNFHVQQGLTASALKWAFTSTDEANWHPLTWISHMADVSLFGLRPAGHHAQSVFWHALNVLLLFLLLTSVTGFVGRSALVAGLFAVHPLNVESVAWVAERKTVLSTFFLLLALAAYGWYAKQPRASRYVLVAVCFSLGLMAKPTVITFPFMLLLLDYWPLDRFPLTRFSKLVIEKLPLFVLSAASAAITVYAQRAGGAVGAAELLPFSMRLKNAICSYLIYIDKAIWPSRLAVFYPHPEGSLALWKVLVAAFVLVLLSARFWRLRQRRYLWGGWLWFIGTLVPMIGLVQVGRQARADRYAYFSYWGLLVIAVWLIAEVSQRIPLRRVARVAFAVAVLLGYAAGAFTQIGYWRNSYTLFTHAIEVTGDNGVAEGNLGSALAEMGRADLALPHLERAAGLIPTLGTVHYDLGILRQQRNDLEAAESEYRLALRYASDQREAAQTHNNLGTLCSQLGRTTEAVTEYSEAIRLNPGEQNSYLGRGMIERQQEAMDAALRDFVSAAQIAPSAAALYWQGRVLEEQGRVADAASAYDNALRLAPDFQDARARLENLKKTGK